MVELQFQAGYHQLNGGGMRSNCCRDLEKVLWRQESSRWRMECSWYVLIASAGL